MLRRLWIGEKQILIIAKYGLVLFSIFSMVMFSPALAKRPAEKTSNASPFTIVSYISDRQPDCDKVIADAQKVLQTQPPDLQALVRLGRCYAQRDRFPEAMIPLDKAIAMKPTYWPAYTARAVVQIQANRPFKAMQDLTEVIEHSTNPEPRLYILRAYASCELDQLKPALPDLIKVMPMVPKDPFPLALHAVCMMTSDPAAAQKEIRDLIAKYPNDINLLRMRLRIERKLSDWSGMEEALHLILKVDPKDIEARTDLANLPEFKAYQISHDFKVAGTANQSIVVLTRSVLAKPTDTAPLLRRGSYYLINLDAEHAVADFGQAVKLDPKLVFAYVQRGVAYRSLEQYDKSFRDFDQALKINPQSLDALLQAARLHRLMHQSAASLPFYDRLIALKPTASKMLIERSGILLQLKKPDLALADAQKAVVIHPGHVELKARALAYLANGQYAKAVDDCTAALVDKPNDLELFHARAQAYQKLGKTALAAHDQEKLQNYNNEIFENAPFRRGQ